MENELDKDRKYNRAKQILSANFKVKEDYERALELLKQCSDYKDAKILIEFCEKNINNNGRNVIKKVIYIISIVVILVLIVLIPIVIRNIKYNKAVALYNSGEYITAAKSFEKLDDYLDSNEKRSECLLNYAYELIKKEDYDNALEYLKEVKEYKNTSDIIKEVYYKIGNLLTEKENYVQAIENFEKADGYADTKNKILEVKYKYVATHKDRNDSYTAKYAHDLRYSNYEGGKEIHKEIFGWQATLHVQDTYGNIITSSKNRHGVYSFVLNVSGGEPDEEETFWWYTVDDNGNLQETGHFHELSNGERTKITCIATGDPVKCHYVVYAGTPLAGGYQVAEAKFEVR